MKIITKGSILATAGSLLLGAGLAVSSISAGQAQPVAQQVHSDKTKKCNQSAACFAAFNYGDGQGVVGYSAHLIGGEFEDGYADGIGVLGEDLSGAGFPFVGQSGGYEDYMESNGDFEAEGYMYAYGYEYLLGARHPGPHVAAFMPAATRATLEDTGTARLVGGESAVRFDGTFGKSIDAGKGYQVFLTPDGDTRGLYVAAKFTGGFIVRETMHGRSTLDFDYRVVAHPSGASEERLPTVNPKRPVISAQ
ncbi:MAG TPA: hypothetical protein VGX91_13350 [Candidatus Cybelea sp.]|jgi:hypothetical protein|nr:hypothetical protein [Candidatus Cybelea sp.]